MVLRWSGRDGVSELLSIGEAVTAVRVRMECGLLSEAFIYQRTLCLKVKENKLKNGDGKRASDDLDSWSWTEWMEILVNEFCCLSIRRNLVDRIIELPWNPDEEKYLHRCLLDSATDDPSSAVGSLLVVFYLQVNNCIFILKITSVKQHGLRMVCQHESSFENSQTDVKTLATYLLWNR